MVFVPGDWPPSVYSDLISSTATHGSWLVSFYLNDLARFYLHEPLKEMDALTCLITGLAQEGHDAGVDLFGVPAYR